MQIVGDVGRHARREGTSLWAKQISLVRLSLRTALVKSLGQVLH